jgi:hypothetical protein
VRNEGGKAVFRRYARLEKVREGAAKAGTYTHEHPDGRKQTILSVAPDDFNWQLGYNISIKVPKGDHSSRG